MITCEDFPVICRLCMCSGELQPINQLNTLSLFKILLQIDINADNLPRNICNECTTQLDNISKFVENCQNCNTILETLADQPTGDFTDCNNYILNTSDKEYDQIEEAIQIELHLTQSLNTEIVKEIDSDGQETTTNVSEFNCSECGKGCSSKRTLAAHMLAHRKDKLYQCQQCSKKFPYAEYLRKHTINKHGTKPFICEICQEGFIRKRSLDEHMHFHTGETPYICSICGQTFKVGRHLNKHMYLFHNPNLKKIPKSKRKYVEKRVHLKLECTDCGKTFASRSGYANHQLIHKGIKKFLCNICGKQFVANAQLQLHLKLHNGHKPFICKENGCSKSFAEKDQFLTHASDHAYQYHHNCRICEQSYDTKDALKEHLLSHKQSLRCSYCDKPFFKKSSLQSHINRHLNLFNCSICSKTFPFASYLKTHMRVHNGEKPYMCSVCGKLFSQKQTLTVHMRLHLGVTPYECSQCDKKYHDSTNLRRHYKRHHATEDIV